MQSDDACASLTPFRRVARDAQQMGEGMEEVCGGAAAADDAPAAVASVAAQLRRYLLDPTFFEYLSQIMEVWRRMDDAVGGAAASMGGQLPHGAWGGAGVAAALREAANALVRPLREQEKRLVRHYAQDDFASFVDEVESDWDALEMELGGI
jgi:hypothetical protein